MNNLKFILLLISTLIFSKGFAENISSFHWNPARGYEPFLYSSPEGISMNNKTDSLIYDYFKFPESAKKITLSFRALNFNGDTSKKYSFYNEDGKEGNIRSTKWGFFFTTENDTLILTVRNQELETQIESQPSVEISLLNVSSSYSSTNSFTHGLNPFNGDNLWKLTVDNGICILYGGDAGFKQLLRYELAGNKLITGIGFFSGWGTNLLVRDIDLECINYEKEEIGPYTNSHIIEQISRTDDPMVGYWTIFDRELEESLLKLGGEYILACIKEDNAYLMIYMDGANINKKAWDTGMVKAILHSTSFDGIYNVEWYDVEKSPLSHDIRAQKGDGNTLIIQFPYQSSRIRLRKLNP